MAHLKSLVLRAYLRYLRLTNQTIVLGPWSGELGFETLYWIPFLHWCLKYAGIAPDRCLAISRGGMGKFYPAANAVDLFTLRTVDEVRYQTSLTAVQTKKQKQTRRTTWDDAVTREAVERVHGKGAAYHVLHPSWMFWLFAGVWEERDAIKLVLDHSRYDPLPEATLPAGFTLPDKFVAVRFYERHTFPLHEGIVQQVSAMVQALASHLPVILLNQPSLCADDHVDLPIAGPNIFTLPAVPPDQNFLLQAAVLSRSQGFVGTYGGVAQWALRYKKPSLSFFTHFNGTAHCHRTLSHVLSNWSNVPFECANLSMTKLWGMCLTQIVKPAPEKVTA